MFNSVEFGVPLSGQSFGTKRTISKFPKHLEKVVGDGLSTARKALGDDAQAVHRGSMIRAVSTSRSGPSGQKAFAIQNELVHLLFQDQDPTTQEQTAKALAVAAGESPPEICLALLEHPGLLDGLVGLLRRADRPSVQEAAALALTNLAGAGLECRRKVPQHPDAMAAIIGLLTQEESLKVIFYGVTLLFVLGLVAENQTMIVKVPGALEGLVEALLTEEAPSLQGRAALTISVLAAAVENKEVIAEYPQLLAGVMKLVELEDLPEVQESAVGAIANLVTEATTPRFLEFPTLLMHLVLLAPSCEAALAALINLELYRRKEATRQMAEHALARYRRLPEFPLLNFPTSA